MKFIYRYNLIAVAIFAFMLLTACQRTELCYDHYPKALLTFDWEQEWERDYGMGHKASWDAGRHGFEYDDLRPTPPEWVNMVKYRNNVTDGEHYLTPDGGNVILKEEENYSFLLYNGDTEYIVLSDIASHPDARASATQRSRSSISYIMEHHPGSRSSNPPDILYSAFIENVPSVSLHETKHVPVKMQPLVFTYVIRYEFEYGLPYVSMARGALAGMAESVYLRDGRTSDETSIILYDCDVKDYGCEAHVRSFGIPGFPDEYYGRTADEASTRPYTLNLELLLTNGKTLEFNYDIADQIKKQPRGGVITVSGIRVEDEQNSSPITSGAFDVELSGWGQVDVDLPLDEYYKKTE
ncbi:MAG: DUF5119 domain-containing protein [Duncaniella sp.]|nr:DUF5119 domain-containing protein [Duncaniella sp.]